MPPIRSISPDCCRRGARPKAAPTAFEFLKREGTSTVARKVSATTGPTPGVVISLRQTLPAAWDGAGDPIEVVGAWSDVTARKQQFAEALAAVQERLVHLLSCDIERKSIAPPPDHLWIGTKSRHVLLLSD
jgi:hypothetical protein